MYADEAAEHIEKLVAQGWSQRAIAQAASVSTGVVSKAKQRGSVIDARTAEAILAVR